MSATPMRAKHQRLVLLGLAMVALVAAGLLAAWALRNQAAYFYVPSDMAAHPPGVARAVRLGGMVEKGSMHEEADGVTVDFIVTDFKARVPVRFAGIRPALFVEGSGVVAEGHMQGNTFIADNLLAKHDERYVPRELKDMNAEQKRQTVENTR